MFSRHVRNWPFAKRILVSSEGSVTEPLYFYHLQQNLLGNRVVFDFCTETGKSAPEHVLKRMIMRLNKTALRPGDEAWLVIDKDRWSPEQIIPLAEWANEASPHIKRRLLVSNPCFELWVLLHAQSVIPPISAREIAGCLGGLLPGYDKKVPKAFVTLDRVWDAIARAKAMHPPSAPAWPEKTGTTLHEAIEELLRGTEGRR